MLPSCAFSLHRSACECWGLERLLGCMAHSTSGPACQIPLLACMYLLDCARQPCPCQLMGCSMT